MNVLEQQTMEHLCNLDSKIPNLTLREFVRKTTGQPNDVDTDFDCKDFQFELYCQEE